MIKQVLILFLLISSFGAFAQSDDNSRIQDQFIVMLNPGQTVEILVKEFPSLQIKKCLSKQMNIWLLQRNTTGGAETFLQSLRTGNAIKLAQFNHHVQSRALVPDDPYFSDQWNMMNTGQGGGTVGADIDATNAWAINHSNTTSTGDTVVVAIIDGNQYAGFDITHEDLNFFVNYNEIPNNGIDDDGNGFVDDYYGWNAFDPSGNIQPTGSSDTHAMLVTGVAAAKGNNGKGVAGVCWGANVLRVVGASGDESQVVEAYDYVREMRRFYNESNGRMGAFVVSSNSSFGIDFGLPADYPIWCAMYDSMGAVGILSAAATNNYDYNIDAVGDMPTACPSKFLIGVTNTTNHDQLNAAYGDTTIALGAPGTGIYSTEPGNSYGSDNGTSFASPHIAGTVAAMYAAACPKLLSDYKLYPDSVSLVVKQMILSGVTRISQLYNRTITGGRLNLYNAIQNLAEYNCGDCKYSVSVTATQPTCSNTCNGALQLNVQGAGTYSFNWSNGATGASVLNNLCPGIYSVTVTNLSTNCSQVRNTQLYKPDSLAISSIHIIPAAPGDSGNIIVSATAGNYVLGYSLDGVNYQHASTLIVSNNGDYNVYVENGIGCVVERTVNVTGIDNLTQTMEWNVFPNPVNDEVNISLNLSKNTNVEISVSNILGQKILTAEHSNAAGLNTFTQNVSTIATGTYFITLSDGSSTSVRRFIIAR